MTSCTRFTSVLFGPRFGVQLMTKVSLAIRVLVHRSFFVCQVTGADELNEAVEERRSRKRKKKPLEASKSGCTS